MKMKNLFFACALGLVGNTCMCMQNAQNPNDANHDIFLNILKRRQEKVQEAICVTMPFAVSKNNIGTIKVINQYLLAMPLELTNKNMFIEIAALMNQYPAYKDYIGRTLLLSGICNDSVIFGRALHAVMIRYPYAYAYNTLSTEDMDISSPMDIMKNKNKELLPEGIDIWTFCNIECQLKKIIHLSKNPTISVDIAMLLYRNPDYQNYIIQTLIDNKIDTENLTKGITLSRLAHKMMQH